VESSRALKPSKPCTLLRAAIQALILGNRPPIVVVEGDPIPVGASPPDEEDGEEEEEDELKGLCSRYFLPQSNKTTHTLLPFMS
jgi:hypothetical protein